MRTIVSACVLLVVIGAISAACDSRTQTRSKPTPVVSADPSRQLSLSSDMMLGVEDFPALPTAWCCLYSSTPVPGASTAALWTQCPEREVKSLTGVFLGDPEGHGGGASPSGQADFSETIAEFRTAVGASQCMNALRDHPWTNNSVRSPLPFAALGDETIAYFLEGEHSPQKVQSHVVLTRRSNLVLLIAAPANTRTLSYVALALAKLDRVGGIR